MRPDDTFEGELMDGADEAVFTPDGHLSEGGAHAFVDGALADADAARTIAHVAGCARCAGVVAEARGLTAAATRILGALDDVPAGVVPNVAAVAPTAPAAATPAAAPVVDLATRRVAPRPRARWTGWPVRAAAGLLLAAGVGGAAWRTAYRRAAGLPAPAAMVSDTAAVATAASAAPATAGAGTSPASASPGAELMADSAAFRRAASAVALAASPPDAAAAGRAREKGAAESRPGDANTGAGRAIELAVVDSAFEARTYAAAPPPPPAEPTPPPPSPAPAVEQAGRVPGPGADERPAAVRRRALAVPRADAARPDSVRSDALRPSAAASDAAGLGAVPGCFVLGGAPRVDGAALPLRVTLDSAGGVTPAVDGLTARWTAAGDSLRLVWGAGKRRRPPRLALRLGPPDADGVRRGTAVAADSTATPASARPVRCDGALR